MNSHKICKFLLIVLNINFIDYFTVANILKLTLSFYQLRLKSEYYMIEHYNWNWIVPRLLLFTKFVWFIALNVKYGSI